MVAAGARWVVLLPEAIRRKLANIKVVVDLNAVPPLGIEGVAATDRKADHDGLLAQRRVWGRPKWKSTRRRFDAFATTTGSWTPRRFALGQD
ncbi:MAG: hypothetical protein WKF75_01070 [Singulisphaera sp.]